jgi:tRNA(fMet)-specific endonuclease VapC
MAINQYMLDTCICSFIQREKPLQLLQRLQNARDQRHRIVISAITYAEMRFGATSRKASPKHLVMVESFLLRLDGILPWDVAAIDQTALIKRELSDLGTPIGGNDTAIAGHALATRSILVTNNTNEFERVAGLTLEDWSL